MGLFESIPRAFQLILALIALVSISIFFVSVEWGNPDKSEENLDKVTGKVVDIVTPTEFTWIDKASNAIQNPYLLMFVIFFVLWIFGYFNKK